MDGENVEKNQCGTIQHDFFEVIARLIYGTLTGTAIDIEDMLAFSVLEDVRPMIESAPDFRTTYRASPLFWAAGLNLLAPAGYRRRLPAAIQGNQGSY